MKDEFIETYIKNTLNEIKGYVKNILILEPHHRTPHGNQRTFLNGVFQTLQKFE